MSYYLTTVSHSTTGTKTITCGFQPNHVRITVCERGTSDQESHLSIGDCDSTGYQVCDSIFSDTTGAKSDRDTAKIVNYYRRVSGAITVSTAAHVDLVAAPWTSTQVKYIVDTADVNAQYKVEVWD